jgi:hypothetical protein
VASGVHPCSNENQADFLRLKLPIHYALSALECFSAFSLESEHQIVKIYLVRILMGIAVDLTRG